MCQPISKAGADKTQLVVFTLFVQLSSYLPVSSLCTKLIGCWPFLHV